ncbi:DUF3606 domain-containing protein [Variovorax sp. RCC_210]|uniref:DUF3606 domain-containing protein n=1 Tax=Variovorax sp. RCC_210 TaxID=3239217 RepID=UPI003525C95F
MRPRTRTQNISAGTASEAKAWAKHLGCSVAELRIAMRAVGNSAENVRAYLDALSGDARTQGPASAQQAVASVAASQSTETTPPPWPPAWTSNS